MSHTNHPPYYEPDEIAPGERLEWRKSLADFNPGDGWELKYYFRNESGTGFDAAGTAEGGSWRVEVDVPPNVAPGRIDWEAWVEDGTDEYCVDSGHATVKKSLRALAAGAAFDGRTRAEKDLDAVRRALVPESAAGVQEYEIGGAGSNRRIRYFGKEELLALETRLAQAVNRERRSAKLRQGAPYFKNIYTG